MQNTYLFVNRNKKKFLQTDCNSMAKRKVNIFAVIFKERIEENHLTVKIKYVRLMKYIREYMKMDEFFSRNNTKTQKDCESLIDVS